MERPPCQRKTKLRHRHATMRVLVACCFFMLAASPLLAVNFTTSLDRETIVIGETATLTLTFEDIAQSGQMPQLPAIPGVRYAPSTGSSFTSRTGPDGKMHTTQGFTVMLVPERVGEIQIPAIQVAVAGQVLTSAPLKLNVLASDPTAPPKYLATNTAFLWLVLPKKEVYVGEGIIGEVRLYVRSDIGNISGLQPFSLSGDGYNADKQIQGAQFQRQVGDAAFTVVPFSFSLIAVKSGTLTIGPFDGSVTVHYGRQDFFGRPMQRANVPLHIDTQTLQSLPLPKQNMPPDFTGAIGNYSMSVTAGPTNVAVGDPITIKVRISGRGPLDAIRLPEQEAWKKFKSYAPNSSVEINDQFGLRGTKVFEQYVSPESTDLQELPPLSFSFFDPDAKQYRTLTQPAIKLAVRPGGSTVLPAMSASGSAPETPATQQDIVPLKQRLGSVGLVSLPLVQQPWFLALQALPILAWLAALGWRKRTDSLANNPRLRRQRQVAQIVREGIAELKQHAASNNSDEFFATLFRLLQEQLGERLDCPASAITEAVIDEKLVPRGVSREELSELHELFQTCNLARYAPIRSSQELAAIVPRFEKVIRQLRELPL